jgi:hypothetical protein
MHNYKKQKTGGIVIKVFMVISIAMLSGCAFTVPAYNQDSQNIETIGVRSKKINVVSVKPSFEDTGSNFCRLAGNVSIQQDKTYSEYLLDSLRGELKTQNLLDEKSESVVSVKLTKVGLSSMLGKTSWSIDGEYTFGDMSEPISTIFNTDSNFVAVVACNNIAANFPNAVSQHLNQFYKSAVFASAAGEMKQNRDSVEDPNVRLGRLKKALEDGLITKEEYKAKRGQIIQDF